MIPTHIKKPTKVIAYKFTGLTSGSADYINTVLYNSDNTICDKCNNHFDDHGLIKTNSGNAVVCPGNYIVNNPDFPDDFYPVVAEIFESTYDNIEHKASSVGACKDTTYSDDSDNISLKALKLRAAEILLDNSSDDKDRKVSLDFMRRLIEGTSSLEPVNDGMSFGEVMALINEDNEILVSRKYYDIDYIYFNSETNQFESYKNGVKTLHSFESKDYTANDWYVVN